MQKDTVSIIRENVLSLSFNPEVLETVDDGGGLFTVKVCNSYHLTAGCVVLLSGKSYQIISITTVDDDPVFGDIRAIKIKDLEAAGDPGLVTFPVAAPKFRHGIAVDVNSEIIKILDDSLVFPMIYLKEPFAETHTDDPLSSIDRDADLFLFALDQVNFPDWVTDDHHNNVLQPMDSLIREFKKKLVRDPRIGDFRDSRTEGYVNFGVITSKGPKYNKVKELIFDKVCSGVGLKLSTPILKCQKCDDICNC